MPDIREMDQRIKLWLLIVSGLTVILLAGAAFKENRFAEWQIFRRQYAALLHEKADDERGKAIANQFEIGIDQNFIPELDVIDRCITCHAGVDDPRMVHEEQPFRTHPGKYLMDHSLYEIGCTVCHDGQGRALASEDAHAFSAGNWEKPLLVSPFLQANCMRCHDVEDLRGLEMVKRGRDLFFTNGCLGCHKVRGKGGGRAPELTEIADASTKLKRPVSVEDEDRLERFHGNLNLAYIFESIKNPNAQPAVSPMAAAIFDVSDEDALALTVYLKGLSRRTIPASYLARWKVEQQTEVLKGRNLFAKYCSACHNKEGKGGIENPNYARGSVPALNTLAEKMFIEYEEDAEYLAELLRDGVDIENMSPPLDIDGRSRVLAQYRAIRDVIKNGSTAGKADPEGPSPLLHMPSWGKGLTDDNIDSVFAYLLTIYPWDGEEEEMADEK